MKHKQYEVDMCNGSLLPKILRFTLPLIASGVLQLLFNAVDIIVVGQYAGSDAMAAVGATSALINLLVNLFIGLSVGVNMVVAKYFGAQKEKELESIVHTAISTAIIAGVALMVLGLVLSSPVLSMMGTPLNILPKAVSYMRIYFLGMVGTLVYNFASAVLRGIGDTKRPLYILFAAGVFNVIFNLLFVIVFRMGVEGVAISTALSQYFAAMCILCCLMYANGPYRLWWGRLRMHGNSLKEMIAIGIPAGLQSMVFSVSQVIIQSAINSFDAVAIAGNTIAGNIEGFVYAAMYAFHQTALSFSAQNYGAKKPERVVRSMFICLGLVTVIGFVLGNGAYLTGAPLLAIYTNDKAVISAGLLRMSLTCTTYCFCGMMDVVGGSLRGLGKSVLVTFASIVGVCGLRIVWIYTIFATNRSLTTLYLSFPLTWFGTFVILLICFLAIMGKISKSK